MTDMYMNLRTNASLRYSRLLFLVLAVAFVFGAVCVGGACGADVWDGKDRTEPSKDDGVYQISTGAELAYVAEQVNAGNSSYVSASYILTDDIDLNNNDWTPIGTSHDFGGIFDGQWHSISNYNAYDVKKVCGLFGFVSGTVRNLIVSGVGLDINQGNVHAGSIVAHLETGGRVENCAVIGSVSNLKNSAGIVGGLIGFMDTDSYLNGWSVEDITPPESYKQWGVVAGNKGNLGASSGDILEKRVPYNVTVYKTDFIGDYPNTMTSTDSTTVTYYSTEGTEINAAYILDDGYYVDEDNSTLRGTVKVDGTLHLHVYLRKLTYLIIIPDSLQISNESNSGDMSIIAGRLWIPKYDSVKITVSSKHDFRLALLPYEDKFLPYNLSVGSNSIQNGGVVKTFTAVDSAAANLNAKITSAPLYSGRYTDLLTFTLQYIEGERVA